MWTAFLLVGLALMFILGGCTSPPPAETRSVGQRIEEAIRGKDAVERDRKAAIQRDIENVKIRFAYDAALKNPVDLPVATKDKQFALISQGQRVVRVRIKGNDGWTMWVVRPMPSSEFISWTQIDRPVRMQIRYTDGRIVETTDEPGLYVYPDKLYEAKYHQPVKRGLQTSALRFLAEPSTDGMEIVITFNRRP